MRSGSARQLLVAGLACTLLAGCAVNPVTGSRELGITGEDTEITIGRQQFLPSQQMQGGTYTEDPELSRYVASVGERVAAQATRKLPYEFVVLDNSIPNAWALPGGKIAVNRGLLWELDNEAELAAVLAHEVVHADARHGARAMDRGLLTQGAMVAAAVAAQQTEYAPLLAGGAQLGAQLVTLKYGRDAEREADLYGMRYMKAAGYDPTAAVTLQEKFVRLAGERRSGWMAGLFASHPPSIERVQNNRRMLAEIGPGGELGRERYAANVARLVALRPAFEAADKGAAALREGQVDVALRYAETALRAAPAIASFHELMGDIHAAQRRYEDALDSYNRALELEPDYFRPLVKRGLLYRTLGQNEAARRDLQASTTLLPTGEALAALGELALAAGDRSQALSYFEAAAGAPGAAGERARLAYARLDVAANPARYVLVQAAAGNRIAIQNRAPFSLSGLVLQYAYETPAGIQPFTQGYQLQLAPGAVAYVEAPNTDFRLVGVSVVEARP